VRREIVVAAVDVPLFALFGVHFRFASPHTSPHASFSVSFRQRDPSLPANPHVDGVLQVISNGVHICPSLGVSPVGPAASTVIICDDDPGKTSSHMPHRPPPPRSPRSPRSPRDMFHSHLPPPPPRSATHAATGPHKPINVDPTHRKVITTIITLLILLISNSCCTTIDTTVGNQYTVFHRL
jgi:hypothetical protein